MNSHPASSSVIRENNLSTVLNLIHAEGSISRADLIRRTNLSATTVSALVSVLIESGIVREAGTGESSGGRRPILIEFNYQYKYVLGVDIGASHVTVLIMDLHGHPLAHHTQQHPVVTDPAGTFAIARSLIQDILNASHLQEGELLGVGLTVPTPLRGEKLDQPVTYYMPAWENVIPVVEIQKALSLPIYVENDANAGAIGEKWWGIGRGLENLAFIKIGVGVGSGLILSGDVYRGHSGTAGEIGHTTIEVNGRGCRCGNHGCLEAYVGAIELINTTLETYANAGVQSPFEQPPSVIQLVNAALTGDPIAIQIIQTAGRYLGTAIANLLNLVDPGIVILNGELVGAGSLLLDAVHASIRQRVMPIAAQKTAIVVSQLGSLAVAIGAATLVIQNAFQPANLAKTLKPSPSITA